MNPETPRTPREELEARLTALLMGELTPEEAAAIQAQMAADPELAALHGRLRKAVELLREASAVPEQSAPATPAQLSSERRERLLAHFKTAASAPPTTPAPIVEIPRRGGSWAARMSVAAVLVALLGIGTLMLPLSSFLRARKRSQSTRILEDLRVIDSSIDQYAIATNKAWASQPGMVRGFSKDADADAFANESVWNERRSAGELARSGTGTRAVPATPPVVTAAPANGGGSTNALAFNGWSDLNSPSRSLGDLRSGSAVQSPGAAKDSGALAFDTGVSAFPENQKPSFFYDPKSVSDPALTGANTYTGGTTINGGTLSVTDQSGTTVAGAGGAGQVTLNGGRLFVSHDEVFTSPGGRLTLESNSATAGTGGVTVRGGTLGDTAGKAPSEVTANGTSSTPAAGDVNNITINGGGAVAITGAAPGQKLQNEYQRYPGHSTSLLTDIPPKTNGSSDPKPASSLVLKPYLSGEPARANTEKEEVGQKVATPGLQGEVLARRDRAKESVNVDGLERHERADTSRPAPAPAAPPMPEANRESLEERLSKAKRALNEQDKDLAVQDETRAKGLPKLDLTWAKPIRQHPAEAAPAAGNATEADAKGDKPAEVPAITPTLEAKLKVIEADKLTDLKKEVALGENKQEAAKRELNEEEKKPGAMVQQPAPPAVPQPEVPTSANAFSTFSLNVTDVSFKLAAASLEQGRMPDPSTVRSEEFVNAFDYRDPEPAPGAPLAFATERARYPFAQNRDLLRFSVKTAAAGRQPGRPLNVVLLLDRSGSMERADRVNIVREALRVLAAELQPQDKLSIVTFARTPRLWADGVAGDKAGEMIARVSEITPEGGTNLEAALDLGYATALRHYAVGNISRVVLFTDGAANLGDVNPDALKKKVEAHRKQGVALDCFGIGWEGYNDDLLEQLTRNGDGRYGFINTPEEAATNFATQLAGALRVAAADVKVQVEFNPRRVTAYRQIGYAKHQLTKEQFRDNTVDAAEIGTAESGNALYVVEVDPRGEGDLATARVRFRVPGTSDYHEHEWAVPFTGNAQPLEQASPALRLAGTAAAFSEMLAASPYAAEVTDDRLLGILNGVPGIYGADPRPRKLEWMIQQARSLSGR